MCSYAAWPRLRRPARRRAARGAGTDRARRRRAAAAAQPACRSTCSGKIVDEVVRADARLAWRSAGEIALAAWSPVRLAARRRGVLRGRPRDDRASAPGADRIVEIGAVRVEGYELADRFERLVDPGVPLPAEITRLTGIRPQDLAGRVGVGAGAARVPGVRRRRRAGGAQRPLRRRLHRCRAAPAAAAGGSPAPCSTPCALAAQARARPHRATRCASLADRFSHQRRAVPSRAARRAGDGRDPARADRQGAGARRRDGRRPAWRCRCRRRRRAHAKRAPGRGGAAHAGHLRDARRAPSGRSTSAPPATCGSARCRTSAAPARPRPVERVLPAVERLEFREAGSPFEARLDEIAPHRRAPARRQPAGRAARPAGVPAAGARAAGAARHGRRGRRRRRAVRRAGRPAPVGRRRRPRACAWPTACAPAARPTRSRRAAWRVASAAASRPAAARPSAPRTPPRRPRWPRRCRAAASRSRAFASAAPRSPPTCASRRPRGCATTRRRCAPPAPSCGGCGPRRSLHGVVLCAHRDPRLVAAFAVAHGLVVEQRPLPRAGDAVLELSALATAVDARGGGRTGPRGPARRPGRAP